MNSGTYEELSQLMEDLSGLIACIDEDSLIKLGRVRGMVDRIRAIGGNGTDTSASVTDIAEKMLSGKTFFAAGYPELCASVERLQKEISALDPELEEAETPEPAAESAAAEESRIDDFVIEEPEAGAPSVESECEAAADECFDCSEYADELEIQLDVLSGLIEDMTGSDEHVLGVIRDLFGKIEEIVKPTLKAAEAARAAAASAAGILAGGLSFDSGREMLAGSVALFMKALKSGGSSGVAAVSGGDFKSAIVDYLENQSQLLDDFESDVNEIEHGNDAAAARLADTVGALGAEAATAGIGQLVRLFESVSAGLRVAGGVINGNMVKALRDVQDYLNDFFSGLWEQAAEVDDNRLETILDEMRKPVGGGTVAEAAVVSPAPAVKAKAPAAARPLPVVDVDTNNPELQDFITESREYLHTAEMALLDLEKSPGKKECVNEIFRGFHNIKGIAGFLNLKDIQEVSHNAESLMDRVRRGEFDLVGASAHAAFAALDMLKDMVERVSGAYSGAAYETPCTYWEVIDRLKNPGESEAVSAAPVVSRVSVEPAAAAEPVVSAPAAEEPSVAKKDIKAASKAEVMIKVGTTRLDNLIDAVGELVITNAMVTQESEIIATKNVRLARNMAQLGKITRELQELSMSMRMVSLKSTFQKMTRLARDLSVKCATPVELVYSGEDTELDRNVVDELGSPLVHMIRNSVDHGIESPEERRQLGKPEKGTIHLSAGHEGGSVVIKIEDDGRGLDKDAILAKAVSQKLVAADAMLTDREIYSLIFHAGFSTAKKVTDVSGRGVGMDVVRKSIEALRGRIEIESERGKGTVFTIRLPLTLAIIDGMVVTVADERYVIPTIAIIESIRPEADQIITVVKRGEMLSMRGELMPLFRLHKLFGLEGAKTDPTEGLAVVIGGNGNRCALLVDDLIGQQQVVIKALGRAFDRLDGVSGGAIMGDGRVALILDTDGLVNLAMKVA